MGTDVSVGVGARAVAGAGASRRAGSPGGAGSGPTTPCRPGRAHSITAPTDYSDRTCQEAPSVVSASRAHVPPARSGSAAAAGPRPSSRDGAALQRCLHRGGGSALACSPLPGEVEGGRGDGLAVSHSAPLSGPPLGCRYQGRRSAAPNPQVALAWCCWLNNPALHGRIYRPYLWCRVCVSYLPSFVCQ